jgi:hypothetical protein
LPDADYGRAVVGSDGNRSGVRLLRRWDLRAGDAWVRQDRSFAVFIITGWIIVHRHVY